MHLINNRYQLLELAEQKGIPSVYDLIDKVKVHEGHVACTDGTTIYIDPALFNPLEPKHQFFILAHELLHIIYKHHEMTKSTNYSNKQLLNICQDIVINEYLAKRLKYRAPDGLFLDNISNALLNMGLIHGPIYYNGTLTTKDLYNWLCRYAHRPDFQNLMDNMKNDQIEPSEDSEESTSPQLLREVCEALKIDKKILAREMNKPEEEVEEYDYVAGKEDARTGTYSKPTKIYSTKDIVKFVKEFIGTNAVVKGRSRTFNRPNRRIHSNDYVMKGYKHTKNIKSITIYLDTSGSMNSQFVSNMYQTLSTLYQTTKFRLFEFDYSIREVDLKNDVLYTGGGTDISKVLRHIKDNKFDVSIMITDCEDTFTLDDIDSDLMIFTNMLSFKSNNPKVQVSYFK